jgi:hypothetical protein
MSSALQALPSDPELHALSGFVALAIGDLSQAQRSLLRAIALGAAEPRTTKMLVDLLIQEGQDGPALDALARVSESNRDSEYWLLRAQALLHGAEQRRVVAARGGSATRASVGGKGGRARTGPPGRPRHTGPIAATSGTRWRRPRETTRRGRC